MKRIPFAAARAVHRARRGVALQSLVALAVAMATAGCVGEPLAPSHSTRDPANPGAPEVAMDHALPAAPPTEARIASAVAPATTATTATDAGVVYTCRMHPEVQQSTPGHCPKCGMTLVPKQP